MHLTNPNESYWPDFYAKNSKRLAKPSPFARYALEFINNIVGDNSGKRLLDIGCGNARDSRFFAHHGLDVLAVDSFATPAAIDFGFVHCDILDLEIGCFDFYYLRFVLHTLTEAQVDLLLDKLSGASYSSLIFIETRSSKSVTDEDKSETFFRSPIGEEHFRMLYSKSYLDEKLLQKFTIVESIENTGLAVFGNEDPVCLRYILKPRKA